MTLPGKALRMSRIAWGRRSFSAIIILRIPSVSVLLYGLTGLASAILNAREKFLPVPLSIVAGNLASFALLVFASASIGIAAAGIAYLLAALVTTLTLWLLVLRS